MIGQVAVLDGLFAFAGADGFRPWFAFPAQPRLVVFSCFGNEGPGLLLPPRRGRRPTYQEGLSMLVLTRRLNETLVIEGGIRVTVLAVKGDRVRLGIQAPPDVRIDRAEIHERRVHLLGESILQDVAL
jgi:carbon storage regulator